MHAGSVAAPAAAGAFSQSRNSQGVSSSAELPDCFLALSPDNKRSAWRERETQREGVEEAPRITRRIDGTQSVRLIEYEYKSHGASQTVSCG